MPLRLPDVLPCCRTFCRNCVYRVIVLVVNFAGLRAIAILVIAGLQLRGFCIGRCSEDPALAVGIGYATHRLAAGWADRKVWPKLCHRAANEPRELVDLYGTSVTKVGPQIRGRSL